jgi:hypothetical protein
LRKKDRPDMPTDRINHPAAILAAIAYWLWGWLWFFAFGNQWLKLLQKSRADVLATGPVPDIISFLMALVLAYGTAIALSHDDERTPMQGVQFGIFVGFAFIASTKLTEYVWEFRPLGLWVLNSAYQILGLIIVGTIICAWKKRDKPSAEKSSTAA